MTQSDPWVLSSRSFSFVSSLQSLQAPEDTAWMLRDLSRALVQPPDALVLSSPRPKLKLVLIMQPEVRTEEERTEEP